MKQNIQILKTYDPQLTVEEIKHYLRISSAIDDNLLSCLLLTAIEIAEQNTGHEILQKDALFSIKSKLSSQNTDFTLKLTPISEIKSIKIDGAELAKSEYSIQNDIINFTKTPQNSIEIIFQCGYQTIPSDIKTGILCHVASMYESRSGKCTLPSMCKEVYGKYRAIHFR